MPTPLLLTPTCYPPFGGYWVSFLGARAYASSTSVAAMASSRQSSCASATASSLSTPQRTAWRSRAGPTPGLEVLVGSFYDDGFVDRLGGPADCVLALEVLEHLFLPRKLFERSREVLKPSGALVLSTPYHGYLKNLAISLAGGWDRHFRVDWDGGHIKFFSKKTLAAMAAESGFHASRFVGVGRLPWLWKSMILVARK